MDSLVGSGLLESPLGASLFVAAVAFALFLAAHWAAWQWLRSHRATFRRMALLWVAAVAVSLLLAWRWEVPAQWMVVVSLDACLMAFYLHLYTGMLRSVSLRILGELLSQPDGRLSLDRLRRLYPTDTMVESRLRWLVQRGWLVEEDGVFRTTTRGRRILRLRRPLASSLIDGQTG